MRILLLILAISLIFIHPAQAIKEKNVTMTISKGDMVYCFFGSSKTNTTICNSIELGDKNKLIDSFLQYLITGQADRFILEDSE